MNIVSTILGEDNVSDEAAALGQKANIEMVERFDQGDYTLVLFRNPDGTHEVALTSNDKPFTTAASQAKAKPTAKRPSGSFTPVAEKFGEWLHTYGTLAVGTLNQTRSNRYHSLLSRMGFQAGPIDYVKTDDMEYWSFDVTR